MLQASDPIEELFRRWARVRVIQQCLVELARVETEAHLGAIRLGREQNGRVVGGPRLHLDETMSR